MRLLVTGAAGFLGREVCAHALARGWDVVGTKHRTDAAHARVRLDVRDGDAVQRTFLRFGPDAVVHTAYVQNGPELHSTVVRGSCNIAEAADRIGARLVHLSSDLVFDGEDGAPYREADEPRPVLAYGAAKAEAERQVAERHPRAVLVRTSLLYGRPDGPQERLAKRDDVTFYDDEIRCPTRVDELAGALLELVELDVAGPLHVAAPTAVSRLELAGILRGDGAAALASASTPPGRPRNVALDSSRAAGLLRTRLQGVRG